MAHLRRPAGKEHAMSPKQQRSDPDAERRAQRFVDDDAAPELDDEALANGEDSSERRIVERPDGYHWISEDGRQEFGPFATLAEAQADMDGYGESADPEEVQAAEDALGLSDWDDADLGAGSDLPGTTDDE
jgi:hypothetical protein